MSYFVEKALDGKARVRMADGAPPLYGDADFRSVQVNLKIRNSVKDIGCTFNGCAADILYGILNLQVRSEEHTSELQSRQYIVCRLLLEKKKLILKKYLNPI